MIDILVLAICIICLYGRETDRGLSCAATVKMKGFASVCIVIHHLSAQVTSSKLVPFFGYLGYLLCALFFFFSGFGLNILKHDKEKFFDKYIILKIRNLLLTFCMAAVIYLIVNIFLGESILYQFAKVRDGNLIVSNSWYVIAIIVFYIVYLFSHKISTVTGINFHVVLLLISIGYIVICRYIFGCGLWWYNSCMGFWLGSFISDKYKNFKKLVSRQEIYCLLITIIVIIFGVIMVLIKLGLFGNDSMSRVVADQISCMLFCLVIALACMKINIGNCLTIWLGKYSFEIYLYHGLFIKILFIHSKMNEFVSVCGVILGTLVTACLANFIISVIKNG